MWQKVAVLVYSGGSGGRSRCPGYVTGRRPGSRKAGGTVTSGALQTTQYLSSPAELDLFPVSDWICLFEEGRICEEEEIGLVLQWRSLQHRPFEAAAAAPPAAAADVSALFWHFKQTGRKNVPSDEIWSKLKVLVKVSGLSDKCLLAAVSLGK